MADNFFSKLLSRRASDQRSVVELSRAASKGDRLALEGLLEAAHGGDGEAQLEAGFLYAKGLGVPQSISTAEFWYIQAADQGVLNAQYNLGVLYFKGEGITKDYKKAVACLDKAMTGGHAHAFKVIYLIREQVDHQWDTGPFVVRPDYPAWVRDFLRRRGG